MGRLRRTASGGVVMALRRVAIEWDECPAGHFTLVDFGAPGPWPCSVAWCPWCLVRNEDADVSEAE
jgi:hypothetical protein